VPFSLVGVIDADYRDGEGENDSRNSRVHDWGFTPIPTSALKGQYIVGWAPGAENQPGGPDSSENDSPVWLTALEATHVCVDRDRDGTIDQEFDLPVLGSARLIDPVDGDMTGALVYSINKAGGSDSCASEDDNDTQTDLALAYGQDPANATPGFPALDFGTTVLAVPAYEVSKRTRLLTDVDGSGDFSPGDLVAFDIEVDNYGPLELRGGTLSDVLDPILIFDAANSTPNYDGNTWACGTPAQQGTPCDLGTFSLPPFTSGVFTLAARISPSLPAGTTNLGNLVVFVADGGGGDPVEGESETPISVATVGDYVWNDLNGDGIQNVEESGVAGVGVNIYLDADDDGVADGPALASTVTDGDGFYEFTGLGGFPHIVEFVPGANWVFTSADVGNDAFDSDANPANGRAVVDLVAGEENVTVDAGLQPAPTAPEPGSILGTVWVDTNNDDVLSGDPVRPGVTVILRDSTDNVVATAVTDSNGDYEFNNLVPGDYRVEIVAPAGYVFVTPNAGADDSVDSDVDATGSSVLLTLAAGGLADIDAGLEIASGDSPAAIGDRVWYDEDGDGIQDAGEPGLPGVAVNLYSAGIDGTLGTADDVLEAMQITGSNGEFLFSGLAAGSYAVVVDLPDGFSGFSPQGAGGDDTLDSDVGPAGRVEVTAVSGVVNRDVDAGIVSSAPVSVASLAGTIYVDTDDGGDLDPGEGLEGVTVVLYDDGGNVIASTLTASDGSYSFDGLPPGDYRIEVDTQTLPPGVDAAQFDDPDSTMDSETTVALAGSDLTGLDFGYKQVGSIGDFVWNDLNGDGVQDAGEPGLDGVEVFLDINDNGVLDAGEPSATTAGGGAYSITGVAPGTYNVRVDPGSLPPGLVLTTGNLPLSVELDAGEAYTDADFGYQLQNAIVGAVYEDLDGDRSQDAGEDGIEGVTVRLLDGNGDEVATTTTAADGSYQFVGLSPGDYTVEEVDPSGYASTTPNAVEVTLPAGEVGIVNFGDLPPGASALVLDAFAYCENDIPYVNYSVTPVGISPESVTIRWDNATFTETLTEQPLVNAALLWPGAAVVDGVGVAWPGWEIVDGAWVEDPTDLRRGPLDFTVIVNPEQTVTLTYPPATPECAAGPSQISGRVYEDDDGSTTQDAGEPGIAGVTIELLDSGGNVVATTQTDGSGFYSFTGIDPGSYTVREVDPGGYASTTGNEVPVTLAVDSFPVADFGDQRRAGSPVAVPVLSPLGLIFLVLGIGLLAGRSAGRRRFAGKL
jgi:protocatechuate 3,4-dioxygenase beta subunit